MEVVDLDGALEASMYCNYRKENHDSIEKGTLKLFTSKKLGFLMYLFSHLAIWIVPFAGGCK